MTKEINQLNLPGDLRYAKTHEWAKVVGNKVVVGLDDYAQDQLGDIVFVEMPEVGAKFKQGEVFANVESVKAVSECYVPISGEIIAVNKKIEDQPDLANNDCYGEGWLVEVKPANLAEMNGLMDSKACLASLKGE